MVIHPVAKSQGLGAKITLLVFRILSAWINHIDHQQPQVPLGSSTGPAAELPLPARTGAANGCGLTGAGAPGMRFWQTGALGAQVLLPDLR